jgi:hypothetical protein
VRTLPEEAMKIATLLAITALLAACATPYQSQGMTGGYSETQLDINVFKVSFRGNGFTNSDRATDLTLMRSAEISLQRGFRYFVIVDSQQLQSISTHTTPNTFTTNINSTTIGNSNRVGNSINHTSNTSGTATTTQSGGETYIISKPRTANTIVCFEQKPEGFSYNAELVLSSLKQKYGIR